MEKLKKVAIYIALAFVLIFITTQYVYAAKNWVNVEDYIGLSEYSDDFEEWVKLPNEERVATYAPKMYDKLDDLYVSDNPIYQAAVVGAGVNARFSLKDKIPANVAIRNQESTSLCWAFAGLSALETNLALNDYKTNSNYGKVYDFSERHANYASTRTLLNDAINDYGVNRAPNTGGQWYLIESYLTNGKGAILESTMPFENNEDPIDINQVNNKMPITTVYDTVYFDNYNNQTGDEKAETMNEIKQHIQNYGSVFATIHGNNANSVLDSCYNNDTGAKYCNNSILHKTDHAVAIIGWDDEYDVTNFPENSRPTSKGAWIIRNSWGENIEYDLRELKEELYKTYPTQCQSLGWNSAVDIPDSFIESVGYEIAGDKVLLPIGDKGLMYVSYEDCNVGATLYGISNSSDSLDYNYVYQYNQLYSAVQISFKANSTILCNVFDKKSDATEYLKSVAITAPEAYDCRVFVNPNGSEKSKDELKLVDLKAGESEIIDKGYHTLEFSEPVEITGDQFVVAVEITGTRPTIDLLLEGKIDGLELFDYAKTETEKCFVATSNNLEDCEWIDLGTLAENTTNLPDGDSSIKAFTDTYIEDTSIDRIEIINEPDKLEYAEGENFDKTGMKVKVYYSNGTYRELSDSDYNIEDGSNLKEDQTYVTITYMNKSITQSITVNEDASAGNQTDVRPINTNFMNCYTVVNQVQSYQYTDDSSKNYVLVTLEVAGISRNMNNDSYEYSYFLSSNSSLKNITDWVPIKESQTANNKLSFKIDSRDIPNYNEVSKSNTIYLYIKESVVKGGNQSVITSNAMRFDAGEAKIETFVDNVKKDNSSNNSNNQNNNSNNSGTATQGDTSKKQGGQTVTQDPTLASTNLPKTGATILAIIIIIVAVAGIVMFVRYEILNKDTKL